jgi:hypothetical protein
LFKKYSRTCFTSRRVIYEILKKILQRSKNVYLKLFKSFEKVQRKHSFLFSHYEYFFFNTNKTFIKIYIVHSVSIEFFFSPGISIFSAT